MKYLIPGARVRVRSLGQKQGTLQWVEVVKDGTVNLVVGNKIDVQLDESNRVLPFHRNQCTPLVKKRRQRIWVGLRVHHFGIVKSEFMEALFEKPEPGFGTANGRPWREFVEVKRK